MGDPYFQQRLFGAYMSNAVPDWRKSLRRRGGSSRRMDLGIISLRNLLAHTRRVGNEPYRIFAESGAPVHLTHGGGSAGRRSRHAPTSFMDSLRPSLGRDRADEYRTHFHDAFLLAVAAVSNFMAFAAHGRCLVFADHIFGDEPLAHPQLLDLRQVRLHS